MYMYIHVQGEPLMICMAPGLLRTFCTQCRHYIVHVYMYSTVQCTSQIFHVHVHVSTGALYMCYVVMDAFFMCMSTLNTSFILLVLVIHVEYMYTAVMCTNV